MGVQVMWSPFQESQALPWSWMVLLRPQQDLEQVGSGTTVPPRPLLFQKLWTPGCVHWILEHMAMWP